VTAEPELLTADEERRLLDMAHVHGMRIRKPEHHGPRLSCPCSDEPLEKADMFAHLRLHHGMLEREARLMVTLLVAIGAKHGDARAGEATLMTTMTDERLVEIRALVEDDCDGMVRTWGALISALRDLLAAYDEMAEVNAGQADIVLATYERAEKAEAELALITSVRSGAIPLQELCDSLETERDTVITFCNELSDALTDAQAERDRLRAELNKIGVFAADGVMWAVVELANWNELHKERDRLRVRAWNLEAQLEAIDPNNKELEP